MRLHSHEMKGVRIVGFGRFFIWMSCESRFFLLCVETMDIAHGRHVDDTERFRTRRKDTVMTLRDCPRGVRVVVDDADLDDRHRFRLREIGLARGVELRVVQRGVFDGRVIAFGGERVALDGNTARAVRVRSVRDGVLRNDGNGDMGEC